MTIRPNRQDPPIIDLHGKGELTSICYREVSGKLCLKAKEIPHTRLLPIALRDNRATGPISIGYYIGKWSGPIIDSSRITAILCLRDRVEIECWKPLIKHCQIGRASCREGV